MAVTSQCILCWAGLRRVRYCQWASKYTHNFKRDSLNAGVNVKMRYDITSIFEMGLSLKNQFRLINLALTRLKQHTYLNSVTPVGAESLLHVLRSNSGLAVLHKR